MTERETATEPPPLRPRRPPALLFLLSLAIILGAGGGLMQAGILVQLFRKGTTMERPGEEAKSVLDRLCRGEPTARDRELWHSFQEETYQESRKQVWINLGRGILNLLLCIGLLAGGLLAFGRRERGRALLVHALGLSLVYEALLLPASWFTSGALAEVWGKWLDRLAQEGSEAIDPGRLEIFRQFSQGGRLLMLAVILVLALFYFWGFRYLRRKGARQYFLG